MARYAVDYSRFENLADSDEEEAEVLALRLYTTKAYLSINAPLRDVESSAPHGMPVIVAFISSAVRKLRAVHVRHASSRGADGAPGGGGGMGSSERVHLFRGLRDSSVPASFLSLGGTELAPMSTTSELDVAMRYSASRNSVILRLCTDSFMDRGADISYLSAFPGEKEILFPPLTYLKPCEGSLRTLEVLGSTYQTLDVMPRM